MIGSTKSKKVNDDYVQDLVSDVVNFIRKPKVYEEICPVCDGLGLEPVEVNNFYGSCIIGCLVCKGKGKIDWIDKIKGKNKEN